MKKLLFLPLLAAAALLSLPGCEPKTAAVDTAVAPVSPEAQLQQLTVTLKARHDQAMDLDDSLMALAPLLQAQPRPPHALIVRIQAADNAMMTWMHAAYGQVPDSTAPTAQRLSFLQEQQRLLVPIEQQLKTTLDSAKSVARHLPVLTGAAPAPATR